LAFLSCALLPFSGDTFYDIIGDLRSIQQSVSNIRYDPPEGFAGTVPLTISVADIDMSTGQITYNHAPQSKGVNVIVQSINHPPVLVPTSSRVRYVRPRFYSIFLHCALPDR